MYHTCVRACVYVFLFFAFAVFFVSQAFNYHTCVCACVCARLFVFVLIFFFSNILFGCVSYYHAYVCACVCACFFFFLNILYCPFFFFRQQFLLACMISWYRITRVCACVCVGVCFFVFVSRTGGSATATSASRWPPTASFFLGCAGNTRSRG